MKKVEGTDCTRTVKRCELLRKSRSENKQNSDEKNERVRIHIRLTVWKSDAESQSQKRDIRGVQKQARARRRAMYRQKSGRDLKPGRVKEMRKKTAAGRIRGKRRGKGSGRRRAKRQQNQTRREIR